MWELSREAAVAEGATCVRPEANKSKLKTINLNLHCRWSCFGSRICFDCVYLCFLASHRCKFRCREQFEGLEMDPTICLLHIALINYLVCLVNLIFSAPHSARYAHFQHSVFNHTDVVKMTAIPGGECLCCTSQGCRTKPQHIRHGTPFLMQLCFQFSEGNVLFITKKKNQKFCRNGKTAGWILIWMCHAVWQKQTLFHLK